jgi:hypothetical protein
MTRCTATQESLSAIIDGELEAVPLPRVLDHLARCFACRTFYRDARALDAILDALEPPLSAPAPASPRRSRWLPAAAAAAALLTIAVGLWAFAARARVGDRGPETGEVLQEAGARAMTDERFVELLAEVLRADRRYHDKLLDVMQQVSRKRAVREGPFEGSRRIPDRRGAAQKARDARDRVEVESRGARL